MLRGRRGPGCGHDVADSPRSQGVHPDRRSFCQRIFFRRGELETPRLRHDPDERGFFRRVSRGPIA